MRCPHNYIEVGMDLERYYMKRNNYARCLQCWKVLTIKYEEVKV